MSEERCKLCDSPTGKAGEDSIFIEARDGIHVGPLCIECLNGITKWVVEDFGVSPAKDRENATLRAERDKLKAELATTEGDYRAVEHQNEARIQQLWQERLDAHRWVDELRAERDRLQERVGKLEGLCREAVAIVDEPDPVEVGCHCTETDTDMGDIICLWCRMKQALAGSPAPEHVKPYQIHLACDDRQVFVEKLKGLLTPFPEVFAERDRLQDACAYAADAIKALRHYYETHGQTDIQDLPLIEQELRKALAEPPEGQGG